MAAPLTQAQINAPVDTSSFTPAQLQAYNAAASLAPKPPAVINSSTLAVPSPINIKPPPVDTTNYNGIVANGSAVVDAHNSSLTPSASTTATGSSDIQKLIDSLGAAPSAAGQYNTDYASSGISGAQTDFNAKNQALIDSQGRLSAVNAQLQGLSAEAKTAKVQAEQSAAGAAPRFVASADQTQIDRALAIKALPLQAQAFGAQAEVAAAQGNAQLSQSILQQAQDHLDKVYQLHIQDATAQYNYKRDVLKNLYDNLTAKEKTQADALQKQRDQEFTATRDTLAYQRDVEKMLLQQKIAPKAPTVKRDTQVVDGKLIDMQTGQVISNLAATPGAETAQKTTDQLTFLKDTATQAIELTKELWPGAQSGIGQLIGNTFIGSTKLKQLEATTNTLRTNVLALATDPGIKKFFGPQMSNADVELMTAAGTSLNPQKQTPEQMRTEIGRLNTLFTKLQNAANQLAGNGPKEGDTHDYNGTVYVVKGGKWVKK